MLTTSETIATLAIWGLTAIGVFFGLRGVLRRIREKRAGRKR